MNSKRIVLLISMTLLTSTTMLFSLTACSNSKQEMTDGTNSLITTEEVAIDTAVYDETTEFDSITEVKQAGPYGELCIKIPESWNFVTSEKSKDTFNGLYGISFKPSDAKNGKIEVAYWKNFGVCGTGLESKTVTLAGQEAQEGTYDQAEMWDFILFGDGPFHGVVIQNLGADEWDEDDLNELESILETISFDSNKMEGADCIYTKDSELENLGLYMYLEDITATSATLVYNQYKEEAGGITGEDYTLEYDNHGEWLPVEYKNEIGFNDIALLIDGQITRQNIDWTSLYGQLKPGTYRVKKTVYYDKEYTIFSNFILK